VRESRPEIPILFLSGYAEAAAVGRDALRDDEPFLAKPYTPEELARAVRGVLDARSPQDVMAGQVNGGSSPTP
jgi:two-component SAPR family response regulator